MRLFMCVWLATLTTAVVGAEVVRAQPVSLPEGPNSKVGEARGQPAEARLSPIETSSMLLPPDIRIQSAAETEGRSLVVWGSFALDARGVGHNVLQAIPLSDGIPAGAVRIAHSEIARPSGFVRVVASADHFLVLWYDVRRFAAGLYGRTFDLSGEPRGDEWRIALGEVADLIAYPGLEDLTLVVRKNLDPLFVRSDGVVDARPLELPRFQRAHVIRPDSSMLGIIGDTIVRWGRFDGDITGRVAIHDSSRIFPEAWILGSESPGNSFVVYLTKRTPLDILCDGAYVVRRDVSQDMTLSAPVVLDSIIACGRSATETSMLHAATRQRTASGTSVLLAFHLENVGGVFVHSDSTLTGYRVDDCGRYHKGVTGPGTCRPGEIPIERVAHETASTIRLAASGREVTLSSPIAPIASSVPDIMPSTFVRGGEAFVIWNRRARPGYATFNLARWPTSPDRQADVVGTHDVGTGRKSFQYYKMDVEEHHSFELFRMPGCAMIAQVNHRHTVDHRVYRLFDATMFTAVVATSSGWRTIDNQQYDRNQDHDPAAGFNPNDGVFSISLNAAFKQTLVFDTLGLRLDSAPRNTPPALVPVSRSAWFTIGTDSGLRVTRVTGDTMTVEFDLPPISSRETVFQRVYGEFFVRAHLTMTGDTLAVERYALNGTPSGSFHAPVAAGAEHLSIVLDPIDSSIALLYASRSGVRVTHLDADLTPRVIDGLVFEATDSVAHPHGSFGNGMLYVAWEDYRNGSADVYGRMLNAPYSGVGTRSMSMAGRRRPSLEVSPVPASSLLTVRATLDAESAELRLVDVRGRTCFRSTLVSDPNGHAQARIETGALADGIYLALLNDGRTRTARRIVIVNER